jgi:hypothetical protein
VPVHVLTFKDIRRVYAFDQEERRAIIDVIQSTPETLTEAAARLNAIRTVRASLPTLPNRTLSNAIPGTEDTLGADYSGL